MPFGLMPWLNYLRDETLNVCLKGQRPEMPFLGARRSCLQAGAHPFLYRQDLRLAAQGRGLTSPVYSWVPARLGMCACAGGHGLSTLASPRTILAHVYVLGRGGQVCEGSVYAQQLLGVRSCGGRLCELGYA